MEDYFAYIRVSTVKQGQHGVSLQEQRSEIQRYADREHLKICEWFEEQVTAAKAGRPKFNAMMKRLQAQEAAGVILHKVDRGTRNFRDWADMGELSELGVTVRIAAESLDLSSRSGRLAADIQVVIAADYIRNLRDETRKGFYGRLKQGLYPLPAPTGYLDKGGGKPKEVDPYKGPLVAAAFDLYASGAYSLERLREEMAERGLTSHRGKPLSKSMIGRMLNNPFYTGLMLIASTNELFKGVHEPLVAPLTFRTVQRLLASKSVDKVCLHNFTYKRLLTCRKCQRFLIGERQKGRVYYRCRGRHCAGHCVREDALNVQVEALLSRIRLSREEAQTLRSEYGKLRAAREQRAAERRKVLDLRIESLKRSLDRLTDLLLDETISEDVYRARMERFHFEIAQTEHDREELSAKSGENQDLCEKVCELAQSAQLSQISANSAQNRELLKETCANLFVDRKNLSIELFPAYQALANRPCVPTGCPSRAILRTLAKEISASAQIQNFAKASPKLGTENKQ